MEATIHVEDVALSFRVGEAVSLKGEVLDRVQGREREAFWALDGLSFEVGGGERFGVIGRNGSGKSTLLRLLSGSLYPDRGRVEVRGELTPLITTSFGTHPELSGVDNLRVMGLYLGLTREQIEALLPRIAEFSELGRFLHEPLKTYSSGMAQRLGVALALQLHPDILLFDEVLGGGDEGFKEKVMAELERLVVRARTVVIVSHQLDVLEALCDRILWIHEGRTKACGPPAEVLPAYVDFMTHVEGAVRG